MGDRRETRGVNPRTRTKVQPLSAETNAEIMRQLAEFEKIDAVLEKPTSEEKPGWTVNSSMRTPIRDRSD